MILNNLTLKIPKELGFANYSNKVRNNSPPLVGTNIPRMVKKTLTICQIVELQLTKLHLSGSLTYKTFPNPTLISIIYTKIIIDS